MNRADADAIATINSHCDRITVRLDAGSYEGLQYSAHRIDDCAAGRREFGSFSGLIKWAEIVQRAGSTDAMAIQILREEVARARMMCRRA